MTLNWTITYNDKRCPRCGRFWCVEQERCNTSRCPCCVYDNEMERYRVISERDRVIRTLKGQITRLKRIKGKR